MISTTPKFPGFGLPLFQPGPSGSFPNALNWEGNGITVREKTMLFLMNSITEKPEWDRKVFDSNVTQKWRQEALDAKDLDVTESMLDWIIAELQDKATSYQHDGMIPIFDYDVEVIKSDTAIPSALMEDLRAACRQLEAVPSRLKDWHPGSDDKVLDFVHPSLFPLIYGRSKVLASQRVGLKDCVEYVGKGETIARPDKGALRSRYYGHIAELPESWSVNFQWLPCQVHFTSSGNVKISSYINNLHPLEYSDLYYVMERCISKTIPLWDRVLSSIRTSKKPRINMGRTNYNWPEGEDVPDDFMPDEVANIEDEWGWESQRGAAWNKSRVLIHPEPEKYVPFKPSADEQFNLRTQFENTGLQIIVKLANIELSPEKPEYEGGSWHIEGQMNERICASALYYYDSENITESFLAFRQGVDGNEIEEKAYDQDDYEGVEIIYGVKQDAPRVQELGRVMTREGRLIAFPNVLQHRVSPFSLRDSSKPGHRKILALFLVDPHIPILSTAHVPPQQKAWWSDKVRKDGSLSMLPVELVDKIFDEVSGAPMSMDEAKEIRLQLMEERKAFMANTEKEIQDYTFSFCEH